MATRQSGKMPRWRNEVCGLKGHIQEEGCKGKSLSKSRENEKPRCAREYWEAQLLVE